MEQFAVSLFKKYIDGVHDHKVSHIILSARERLQDIIRIHPDRNDQFEQVYFMTWLEHKISGKPISVIASQMLAREWIETNIRTNKPV